MRHSEQKKIRLGELKRCLAAQIKLDIATRLRQHPHLGTTESRRAYKNLAGPNSINNIIRDMAREEVEESITRGEIPGAAMIHMAGYTQNHPTEG